MEDDRIIALYLERDEAALTHTSEKYGRKLKNISYGITEDKSYSKSVAAVAGVFQPVS